MRLVCGKRLVGYQNGCFSTPIRAIGLYAQPRLCPFQGSSDHALYVVDAAKGTKKRTLYNKTSGHSE